jgi:hypothetical protein
MYSRRRFLKTTASAATASVIPHLSSRPSTAMSPGMDKSADSELLTTLRLDANAINRLAVKQHITLSPDRSDLQLDSGRICRIIGSHEPTHLCHWREEARAVPMAELPGTSTAWDPNQPFLASIRPYRGDLKCIPMPDWRAISHFCSKLFRAYRSCCPS